MAESAELKVKRCAPFALKLTDETPYGARMSPHDAYKQLLALTRSCVGFPDQAEVDIEDLCARAADLCWSSRGSSLYRVSVRIPNGSVLEMKCTAVPLLHPLGRAQV